MPVVLRLTTFSRMAGSLFFPLLCCCAHVWHLITPWVVALMNEWNGGMRCHAPASVVVVVARPPVFADEVVGGCGGVFSR